MRNLFLGFVCLSLTACGAIGIGSNHMVTVNNTSQHEIYATGDMGKITIAPKTQSQVYSKNDIQLISKSKKCEPIMIERQPNVLAIFLDIVPGFVFYAIPIIVDGVSGNLYRQPNTFTYGC